MGAPAISRNVWVPLVLLGAAVAVVVALNADDEPQALPVYTPESVLNPAANSYDARAGLRIEGGKLVVADWDEWMRTGPALIKVSMLEGNTTPEDITTNVLRRVFPEYPWPPNENHAFFATWKAMNLIVGRALDQPTQPHLEVVS